VSARRRLRLVSAALLAGLAAWQLGGWAWMTGKAFLAQEVLLPHAFERALAGEGAPRPWPWADITPVARLEVPSRGIDRIVLDGVSGQALAFGPGLVPGAPEPGTAGGTVILAGHRDSDFAFLQELVPGERVYVTGLSGIRRGWEVAGAEVVPAAASGLDPARGGGELALVTCFPFDAIGAHSSERYLVLARPLGPVALADAGPAP
jgi:sortase A